MKIVAYQKNQLFIKEWVFATNADLPTPLPLQSDVIDLSTYRLDQIV